MRISRRTFIKGLGSGLTALGLSDVILWRPGWAGLVAPAKITAALVAMAILIFDLGMRYLPIHPLGEGALGKEAGGSP
jgi:hypothetical protein